MPRYHFSSVDGFRDRDPDGTELPDLTLARAMAVRYAGEVLQSDPDVIWHNGQWRVEVTDDDGILLFTLLALAIDAPVSKQSLDPASDD